MDDEYTYDEKFEDNVPIIGQTACRKTTFIQKLAKNKMFGNLKETYWITKVPLSDQREKKLLLVFKNMLISNIRKL